MSSIGPSDDLQDWINGLAEQLAEARNERDAAIAALGDVEPLEDVLGIGYWVSITTKRTDSTWIAIVGDHDTGAESSGYGATIDAAIRAAVANAKGGE